MKLVTFQEPVFQTVQGEGIYVGTPSLFIRLWGCDQEPKCSWCDTKGSWEAGSEYADLSVSEVANLVREAGVLPHVVVTGGNPLVQGEELNELLGLPILRGRTITVETQASVFHPLKNASVVHWSLSPKMHTRSLWNLQPFLGTTVRSKTHTAQIKLVVRNEEEVREACSVFEASMHKYGVGGITYVLQPEHSVLRKRTLLQACTEAVVALAARGVPVKLIPQVHKLIGVV